MRFRPASVQRIESLTADAFKRISRDAAVPLHLSRDAAAPARPDLFKLLRLVKDRFVDVELGRYNDKEAFEKVSIPLSAYLDWLQEGNSTVGGKQMYLAQSNLIHDIPELKAQLAAPSFFEESIKSQYVNLYQASLFLGPTGAVTPLHCDPTANLFELVDSSSPEAAKHFLLFPPDLQLGGSGQRNTSDLEFNLHDQDQVSGNEDLKDKALVCVLKKGEILYVPNRWWHRVENVRLDGGKGGWNAGLGFWHMKR